MRHKHRLAMALLYALLLTVPLVSGAEEEKARPKGAFRHEEVKEEAAKVAAVAGQRVKSFAEYADGHFERATGKRAIGWALVAGAALICGLSMFFGWALVQSLLVPCAPVLGLATGGFMAFCVIEAIYTQEPWWFRVTLFVVGAGLGVALYLFSALKAKPVAAFLVVLSPFLIIAIFFFSYNEVLGLITFCAGLLAGFAAMIEMRPLAIVATSMLGGCAFLAGWGLLSYLLGEQAILRGFFEWLINNPLMLAAAWAALVFVGASFQFTTGPRGALED